MCLAGPAFTDFLAQEIHMKISWNEKLEIKINRRFHDGHQDGDADFYSEFFNSARDKKQDQHPHSSLASTNTFAIPGNHLSAVAEHHFSVRNIPSILSFHYPSSTKLLRFPSYRPPKLLCLVSSIEEALRGWETDDEGRLEGSKTTQG